MIELNHQGDGPLYEQIYRQLRAQILNQTLPAGTRLPSSRELAAQLQISRNTVNKAYSQLLVEGYLAAVRGSGYYVQQLPQTFTPARAPQRPGHSRRPAKPAPAVKYDLTNSSHTRNLFPKRAWRKFMLEALDTLDFEERISTLQSLEGEEVLRRPLLRYLRQIRGVHCDLDQLIITSGLQQSLDYLCQLVPATSGRVLMEEPGYPKARVIFEKNHRQVCPAALDDQGICLPAEATGYDFIYTTPSNQFPTGVMMSAARRRELLHFAAAKRAFILEDDYDSELRYYNRPVPALQSIDTLDRVVYLGTFSKILSPSLRMGYLILPKQLVAPFKETFKLYNSTVNLLNQYTVAKLLESGEYTKLVRRMNTTFKKRFEAFSAGFASFKRPLTLSQNLSGQYLLVEFPVAIDQEKMIARALAEGVRVYPTMEFWRDRAACPDNALFLGFSKIALADIPDCIERLKRAWDD